MKQKLLLGLALFAACTMASAQDVPVADLLDVQFNGDGTAVDISPMENEVTFLGDGTVVEFNTFFGRNVPKFGNTWGSAPAGAYHVDFENNQAFRDALADGHSLEMLVSADYQGTIANSEAKPFSAMQGGGTGFLVTTISGSRQNEWCFLPNVTTTGNSTWRWTTSGVVPRSGIYYHVIGVWNKEEQKSYIYVNGELKNVIDAPGDFKFASTGSNWFGIGCDADASGGGQSWPGEVVIARVYDKALDGAEADALWQQVANQTKEANAAVYMELVSEGRLYIEDVVATQSLIDEYEAAMNALEELTKGTATDKELDDQLMAMKSLRTQIEASAAAYVKYKERADAAIAYLEENSDLEGDDRDYIAAYLSDYIEPNENYPHGSYSYIMDTRELTTEEVAAEGNWVDEMLRLAVANGFKAGQDVTSLLKNYTFADGFTGWSGTVATGYAKSNTTDYYGVETWARGFDMYQTLTGLENGVYVLTVNAAYRPFNDRYSTYYAANVYANDNFVFLPTVYETRIPVEEAQDGVNCYLTQNGDDASLDLEISEDGSSDVTAYGIHGKVGMANAANGGRALNTIVVNVTDGTLKVGFRNPNPDAATDWTGLANVHLLYAGALEDAVHYIDETLACMVARAQTIINIVPESGDAYAQNPNCPQAIKDKLQAAVDAVATATTAEEKYALIETFSGLWTEFMEGRAAYVAMVDEAETIYGITADMYSLDKLSKEEFEADEAIVQSLWAAFTDGTYSTEEALNLEPLRSAGLLPTVDEKGVYQITNNYEMAYYAYKAGRSGKAVNGNLLADIDFFTENQMMENFYGTFEGNYHTITVDIHRNGRGAALINNMQNGAVVRNLTIKGDVSNSDKFATSVAANIYGVGNISGITSLIHVYSTTQGDASHAGILSCSRGTAIVKDCVFAGVMEGEGAINNSGIVGWTNGVTMIENCLQIGDIQLSGEGSATIARIPESVTVVNTYYKTPYGEVVTGTQITDEQLANGEVCYLLNKGNTKNPTWFQTLGEDPYPVPNPSHAIVGKKADGTYTNDPSQFVDDTIGPVTGKGLLLDVVFNEDGTAEDLSPQKKDVTLFGETTSVYYSEEYKRYVARFDNPWGSTATGYYKADFEDDQEYRNALADGHSLEVLCMASYEGEIPNSEAKPFSAMQGGGTGFLITTISGARQNELCFLPNITTSGSSTWRWNTSGVVPESNVFYHVVGVWDPEQSKTYIYVNGELKKELDSPGLMKFASAGCNWFAIGGDPANATSAHGSWKGDVAIARVYDQALTADEVAELWKNVDPTGVEKIADEPVNKLAYGIYKLNGVRVDKAEKGIYIIDGKKTLVK